MKLRTEATLPANENLPSFPSVFVILGAAVWEGGRPSNAMRRRVSGALRSATGVKDALFLVTGGVGRYPPSEARVMFDLLREADIPVENILLDEAATDTLESIQNCVRILKSLPGFAEVVVCSDIYHIPRCRYLFRLYGIPTRAGRIANGRSENRILRWWYYYLREVAALPWDALLVLIPDWLRIEKRPK